MKVISNPLVTIGIPFYNAEKYILETLESVKSQSYKNIQLILVDDCSTDDSYSLVENWLTNNKQHFSEISLLKNKENKGTSYSCKKIQDSSTGDYFCKLDADDLIAPNKIVSQVEFLLKKSEYVMVYSNTRLIDSNGKLLEKDYFDVQRFSHIIKKVGPSGFLFDQLINECFIPNSSVMIRREILCDVGGYDPAIFTEDWDLWLRIAKRSQIAFMPGYFSSYRIHSESVMRQRATLAKMYRSSCIAVLKHIGISENYDKVIKRHLYKYSIGMYRLGVIDKYLLKKNFLYNKSFKSSIYFGLGLLNLRIFTK